MKSTPAAPTTVSMTQHHWWAPALLFLAGASLWTSIAEADSSREAELRACAEAVTKRERHVRRCWRFDAVERGTWRAYDRDTARDWRTPKDWERR